MEDKDIHLREYLRIITKRKQTVCTFFAVVFVMTLIVTFSATPLYLATTKVLIEKAEPNNIGMMNMYYMPYDPDFYETQYQLIKSTSVARKVVKMLSLDRNNDAYLKGEKKGLVGGTIGWFRDAYAVVRNVTGRAKPEGGAVAGMESEKELEEKADAVARTISASIIVTPVKNSKLVHIGYMSPNPEFAALIANSVAKAYIEDLLDMKMISSRNAMKWLTEKAEEEKTKLQRSEKALQEYMRTKDIVTLENRITMVPEKLSEVATKIAAAETKRKELESHYEKVREVTQNPEKAETIPAISSDPTVQALRVQILKAEQNMSELSKKFGSKHPTMVTAQADLKVLKEKREQEIRRVVESIRNEYELAKSNETNFRRMAAQTKQETLNLNEKFVQYEALKREAETSRQLFDAIIKKIKEQDITQDIRTVNVWVVEKAETPAAPTKPEKGRNILIGLLIGLFGGIGIAFLVDHLDNTVKSVEEVEEKFGVPVLGVVTLLKSPGTGIEEISMKEPRSAFAESYKILRTAVLLSSGGAPPKNVLITSVMPGEGKTATSVNLAMTIAQAEHSVLLIDADLRKPRIHRIFGLNNDKGLSTYLAGASDIDIVVSEIAPNLSVIPSGPIPPNPSELLGSANMRTLIETLKGRFDFIIWDTTPLMTVTDSLILSANLDGTILVTKAGYTTYEGVSRALKSLQGTESRLLGIVINGLDVKKNDYYSRYYGYGYGYGQGEENRDKAA
ncbi:MAG TPA: polysaccharide biosynthesis tyrosine autokinase [Dissulfurispiraceae bacterium]|nr:polysaccharide biosynthesis tyrosine autokinase [Dissulfurispiraceae bacterium]